MARRFFIMYEINNVEKCKERQKNTTDKTTNRRTVEWRHELDDSTVMEMMNDEIAQVTRPAGTPRRLHGESGQAVWARSLPTT